MKVKVTLSDYNEIDEMKNSADVTYQKLTKSDGFGH